MAARVPLPTTCDRQQQQRNQRRGRHGDARRSERRERGGPAHASGGQLDSRGLRAADHRRQLLRSLLRLGEAHPELVKVQRDDEMLQEAPPEHPGILQGVLRRPQPAPLLDMQLLDALGRFERVQDRACVDQHDTRVAVVAKWNLQEELLECDLEGVASKLQSQGHPIEIEHPAVAHDGPLIEIAGISHCLWWYEMLDQLGELLSRYH
mmetsp:Transcript_66297/g.179192  ORF Transcript_66297/g.179192 Transcript_66297/m.179192 type:complete len:208 (-) Transcript_66297:671-1294(-)